MNKEKTRITAKIAAYHEDDLHIDYEDGSFESFDATELRILLPREMKDQTLYIYHKQSLRPNNIWRKKDSVITFIFNEAIDIKKVSSMEIYSDGVMIQVIEPNVTESENPDHHPIVEINKTSTLYYFTPGEREPLINHANFNIKNNSEQDVSFYIKKAEFISNQYPVNKPLLLTMTWIHQDNNEHIKVTDQLHIGPGERFRLSLFFKGFTLTPAYYENIYVLLTILCGGKEYQGISPIDIVKKNKLK